MSVANLEREVAPTHQTGQTEMADVIPFPLGEKKEHVLFLRGLLEPNWWLKSTRKDVEKAGYQTHAVGSRFPMNVVYGEMEALEKYATELTERQEGPIIGIGHSMGGLIVDLFAEERPDLIKGTIALGSPLNLPFIRRNVPRKRPLTSIHILTDHIVPFPLSRHDTFTNVRVSPLERRGVVLVANNHFTLPHSRNVKRAIHEALSST